MLSNVPMVTLLLDANSVLSGALLPSILSKVNMWRVGSLERPWKETAGGISVQAELSPLRWLGKHGSECQGRVSSPFAMKDPLQDLEVTAGTDVSLQGMAFGLRLSKWQPSFCIWCPNGVKGARPKLRPPPSLPNPGSTRPSQPVLRLLPHSAGPPRSPPSPTQSLLCPSLWLPLGFLQRELARAS